MDIYSTYALSGVISRIRPLPQFFLDTFFPTMQVSDKEEIYFDVIEEKPRVTPFVHPLRAGKLVEQTGFYTNSFKPAYVKDKRVFNPAKGLKRTAGEQLTGSLTPDQRLSALLAADLADQKKMLSRRFELMAAEAIIYGTQTIIGDGVNATVNFQRNSALTIALSGDAKWDATANTNRGQQIEDWDALLLDAAGVNADCIVMDRKAWKLLKDDATFKSRLLSPNVAVQPAVDVNPMKNVEGVAFKGYYGEYPIYVYSHTYIDPTDGQVKNAMPDNTVVLASKRVDGVRHFGAIQDLDAGLSPLEYFVKSWTEQEPSQRFLLAQSAPLMVPYRPNATLRVTVA